MQQCFKCKNLINNYAIDKKTCASCREVFKIDLVRVILRLDPIYLSESTRNKKGRKPKLTADAMNDIRSIYNNPLENEKICIRDLAKKYNVSVGTISRIIHN